MINKNYKKGFTLVETLGAVLLLSISLVGPMVIAQKGLQASLIAKDQNSAFNLAQDAVEYVRFARDTNCLAASAATLTPCPAANWLSGGGLSGTVDLTNCFNAAGTKTCGVDSQGNTAPQDCGVTACTTPLKYDSGNNYIVDPSVVGSGIVPTIFTRSVNIKYDPACSGACNPAEADVNVTVTWSDPIMHTVVVNENIYDWQ